MNEPDGADPLRDLGERLDRARRAERRAPAGDQGYNSDLPREGIALALRVATELVAALLVSSAIGWGIDRWFGTQPWGLIVFFFLGAAAGTLNVYRAVGGSGMMEDGESATKPKASQPRPAGDQADEDED